MDLVKVTPYKFQIQIKILEHFHIMLEELVFKQKLKMGNLLYFYS